MGNTIEIPFGAFDSELKSWECTIPEGYEARIEGDRVIIKPKENEYDKIRKEIISYFQEEIRQCSIQEHADKMKEFVAWLEKQKPEKWSEEEDDRILYNVTAYVGYAAGQRGVSDKLFKEANDWLRSLRPHNHWKPSDGQMNALKNAAKHFGGCDPDDWNATLESLYNDLKKLKE